MQQIQYHYHNLDCMIILIKEVIFSAVHSLTCAYFAEICRLPQVSGRCMSYKPRYFFDWNAGVCREFVYGGCEGNANNFDDVDACERTCAQYMNRPPGELKEKTAWAYSTHW